MSKGKDSPWGRHIPAEWIFDALQRKAFDFTPHHKSGAPRGRVEFYLFWIKLVGDNRSEFVLPGGRLLYGYLRDYAPTSITIEHENTGLTEEIGCNQIIDIRPVALPQPAQGRVYQGALF